jgi:uncharacterized membrane protein SirB2
MVHLGVVSFVFFMCGSLNFMGLWVYSFHQIWQFLTIIPLRIFFCLLPFPFLEDSSYKDIRLLRVIPDLIDALCILKNSVPV